MRMGIYACILGWLLVGASLCAAVEKNCGCKGLTDDHKEIANRIFQSEYVYDCCDKTLAACMAERPACRLASRLAGQVCRMVKKNDSPSAISKALAKRAETMMRLGKPAVIDRSNACMASDTDAPVLLDMFLCVRCPFCAKRFEPLYREITEGALKGKVRLVVHLFPLKGHTGSVEGGLAAMAAKNQGGFLPFLLHAYKNFDSFSPQILPTWAQTVGLDIATFTRDVADVQTRKALTQSKREGLAHGVQATPTLFINGRLCEVKWDQELIVDLLDEEHDFVTGRHRASSNNP